MSHDFNPCVISPSTIACGCDKGCSASTSAETMLGSVSLFNGNAKFSINPMVGGPTGLGSQNPTETLYYDSNSMTDGAVGPDWNNSSACRLEPNPTGCSPSPSPVPESPYSPSPFSPCPEPDEVVDLLGANLTRDRFNWNPTAGKYEADSENNTQAELHFEMDENCNPTYKLIGQDGTTTCFQGNAFGPAGTAPLHPTMTTDRYGNQQSYVWGSYTYMGATQYRITQIVDTYGRTSTYTYDDGTDPRKIKTITYLGNTTEFYYSGGLLVAIRLPDIELGADGNTNKFKGGTAYVYKYDGSGRLTGICYPNEVQDTDAFNPSTGEFTLATAQMAATRESFTYDGAGRISEYRVGNVGNTVGGTYTLAYANPDEGNPYYRTTVTDRRGYKTHYDFNANGLLMRSTVVRRIPGTFTPKVESSQVTLADTYVTLYQYNTHNQVTRIDFPNGDYITYEYDSGTIPGLGLYNRRAGQLLSETHYRGAAADQDKLTSRYFYDPIYNQRCLSVGPRGNPVTTGNANFPPQNGGDASLDRYATFTYFDYQKNVDATVVNSAALQAMLFPGENSTTAATNIGILIAYLIDRMDAAGVDNDNQFALGLGDINGDGTGDGNVDPLPSSPMLGSVVKVRHPAVRLVGQTSEDQERLELYTSNLRGQTTTYTDPEGNVTIYLRNSEDHPQGDPAPVTDDKRYGFLREIRVDVDPEDVVTALGGADADLTDFIVEGIEPRDSRQSIPDGYDEFQDLSTKYYDLADEDLPGYDAMGNVLLQTDPRGHLTQFVRNERGEVYRVVAPAPYSFILTETFYDANRNVIREDIQDKVVQFIDDYPESGYGHFSVTGKMSTANLPLVAGLGGATREGWYSKTYEYDLLDNKTQETIFYDYEGESQDPAGLTTEYAYDPSENLAKITKPEGNIVEYDYDERNLRIAMRAGYVDAESPGATTVYLYDSNGNLFNQASPAALTASSDTRLTITINRDPFDGEDASIEHTGEWVFQNTFDGLNRLASSKDALGNVAEYEYDPDGRVIHSLFYGPAGGASPTDRDGDDNVLLNESYAYFDEAGRQYEAQNEVFLNTGKSGGSPTHGLPSGRSVTHTGGGLEHNTTDGDHTGSVTLTTGGESYVLQRTVFDRSGRAVTALQDILGQTTYQYDGANRLLITTSNVEATENGNSTKNLYDDNSNLIQVTRIEKPTNASEFIEQFVTRMAYDVLNRLVIVAGQGVDGTIVDFDTDEPLNDPDLTNHAATLFTLIGYDSRGNRTVVNDPKANTTLFIFDGANRTLQTSQLMRTHGDGDHEVESIIGTQQVWDLNSRLTALQDSNDNITNYVYDSLDRQIEMIFPLVASGDPDNSRKKRIWEYYPTSNVLKYTDESENEFDYTLDALGRTVKVEINRAAGVEGTTEQTFQYDGLSRRTLAVDMVDPADVMTHVTCAFAYDSLGRLVEESQLIGRKIVDGALIVGSLRYVTHHAFKSLAATGMTYPDGRQITMTLETKSYRLQKLVETSGSTDIAAWEYFGPSRVATLDLANGLRCSYMNNALERSAIQSGETTPGWGSGVCDDRLGYDGAGRLITKRFLTASAIGSCDVDRQGTCDLIVGFTSAYDKSSNKLFERALHAENRSQLYQYTASSVVYPAYDSINRLLRVDRGTLASGGQTISSEITLPGTDELRSYDLDKLGNWENTGYTPQGLSPDVQYRCHDGLNRISTLNTNGENCDGDDLAYDDSSNITNDLDRTYTYDAMNRLLTVASTGSGTPPLGRYVYDALGRRVRKFIPTRGMGLADIPSGGLSGFIHSGVTDYVHLGWRVLEERGNDGPAGKGLLLHWEMDGFTGNEASDSTGNDHNGTITGATWITNSVMGNGLSFDGDDDDVNFTAVSSINTALASSGEVSVSVWVKPDYSSIGSRQVIGGCQKSADDRWVASLTLHQNGKYMFSVIGVDGVTVTQKTVLADSAIYGAQAWTHLCGTYDGSTVKLYVNGKLQGDTKSLTGYVHAMTAIRLGRDVDNAQGTDYHGLMDDFRLYSKALTASQVAELASVCQTPARQLVWGLYIDELVQQRTYALVSDALVTTVHYPLQDQLYRTAALTDSGGCIAEAYDYDAYGNTMIYKTPGTGSSWWASDAVATKMVKCEHLFTGRQYDPESEIYHYRARYYLPKLGRFGQRDPIGYKAGTNLFLYATGNSVTYGDPSGTDIATGIGPAQPQDPAVGLPQNPARLSDMISNGLKILAKFRDAITNSSSALDCRLIALAQRYTLSKINSLALDQMKKDCGFYFPNNPAGYDNCILSANAYHANRNNSIEDEFRFRSLFCNISVVCPNTIHPLASQHLAISKKHREDQRTIDRMISDIQTEYHMLEYKTEEDRQQYKDAIGEMKSLRAFLSEETDQSLECWGEEARIRSVSSYTDWGPEGAQQPRV